MKKTILSILILSFVSLFTYAQHNKCGTMINFNERLKENPNLIQDLQQVEKDIKAWIKSHKVDKSGGPALITIPTVFHVVYNPSIPEQNIHDSLIYSQLDVLNRDYRRLNPDTVNTRTIFDSIAADIQVEFCLASVDPQGNWTSGINRVQTTQTSFFTTPFDNSVKSSSTGGADPWPASDYLNIWVCDMGFNGIPFVLGYAQFPNDDPNTDGVVITYQHFGDRWWDANAAPANLGRTATHEVGHWLGLYHIWGDGDCTQIDSVPDTPNADAASQSDCDTTKNTCDDSSTPFWNGIDPPDMVENYMDYSADACMNMFTLGQKTRMWGFINNSSRTSLLSSTKCALTSINENDLYQINVMVYPNPANSDLTLEWPSEIKFKKLILFDVLGNKVVETDLQQVNGKYLLNLNGIDKGAYLVQLSNGYKTITKKVIVN